MQRHFTGLLLRPSLFSGSLTTLLALSIVTVSNWAYVLEHVFFYDYLFGPEGLITNINNVAATDGLHNISDFLGGSVSYNVLILGVAVLVGVVVYVALQVFGRFANNASAAWESIHGQTNITTHDIAQRWAIRIAVAFAWMIYCLLFIKIILPFCILAAQVGIRQLWAPSGIAYFVFGTALTWASAHMHVVFLRLVILRPRVFGGEDEILEDEFRGKYFPQ